ncbi:hypothetical protein [Actinomadura rudentiformis]|uniref:Uncharacterized protein n=1 Tax=Actinomadura rudentiformis TaxID=359158 RepID=A0A6H9YU50_9ACTN|nr:hypothetical protein [Actinomadura rudentiformis]KAB2347903.1 hypothetical protein F8566_18655 [Actinomadura rudentiformis]
MTLASNLRENKAVYTFIGGGDLAAEKVRELPEQMTKARETATKYQGELRETVDKYRGHVREQVRETVGKYRGEAREAATKLQDRVEVKDLPGAAVAYVTHFGTRTVEFIDELAERGKKVVHREAEEVAELTEAKPAPKARAAQQKKTAQSQTKAAATKKTDA